METGKCNASMPTKCIDHTAMPKELLPASIHNIEVRPVLSRMRCACVSAVKEPIIEIITESKINGTFQLICKTIPFSICAMIPLFD